MTHPAMNKFLTASTGESDFDLVPLTGGANNRGYKVITRSRQQYFLKCFPKDISSSLAKMTNEFSFVQALQKAGIQQIPKAIDYSETELCALYEFLQGEAVHRVNPEHVKQAINFISVCSQAAVNRNEVAFASESPTCWYDFLSIIHKRLNRFYDADIQTPLKNRLFETLHRIEHETYAIEQEANFDWQQALNRDCLSPSDFGFHNAIETQNGLKFIDFEYAGKDSAVKLFCDFYAQPAKPVSLSTIDLFFRHTLFKHLVHQPQELYAAWRLTLLKWCLIMLNEFLPEVQERRIYSWMTKPGPKAKHRLLDTQREQLDKCEQYYLDIQCKLSQLIQIINTDY